MFCGLESWILRDELRSWKMKKDEFSLAMLKKC
jgi:hypothetical protein